MHDHELGPYGTHSRGGTTAAIMAMAALALPPDVPAEVRERAAEHNAAFHPGTSRGGKKKTKRKMAFRSRKINRGK